MFISFEGPEGAGKSTAIRQVADHLEAIGHQVVTTREPGAGEFGRRIRAILLEGDTIPIRSELLLFLADRANHVDSIIRPALDEDKIVLCDRHADSTLVYQGLVRGLNPAFVRAGNAFATDGLVPDLTLLFDLPAAVGLARIENKDRLDKEPLEFHQKVREGFLKIAKEANDRFVILDALQSKESLAESAISAIVHRLDRSS